MAKWTAYWKAIIAATSPVFLVIQAAITDDQITSQEWYAIGFAAVVAVGVLRKANTVDGDNVATTTAHVPTGSTIPDL